MGPERLMEPKYGSQLMVLFLRRLPSPHPSLWSHPPLPLPPAVAAPAAPASSLNLQHIKHIPHGLWPCCALCLGHPAPTPPGRVASLTPGLLPPAQSARLCREHSMQLVRTSRQSSSGLRPRSSPTHWLGGKGSVSVQWISYLISSH